jgi:hypothetical protein
MLFLVARLSTIALSGCMSREERFAAQNARDAAALPKRPRRDNKLERLFRDFELSAALGYDFQSLYPGVAYGDQSVLQMGIGPIYVRGI